MENNNKQYVIIHRFYDTQGILRFLGPSSATEEETKTLYLNQQFFSKKYYGNNYILINSLATTIITPKNNIITLYKYIKSLCKNYVNLHNEEIKNHQNKLKQSKYYSVYFYEKSLYQLIKHTQETLEEYKTLISRLKKL